MSEAPQQSTAGYFDWVYGLGGSIINAMRGTMGWNLDQSTETEDFTEREVGQPESTSCAATAEPPEEEAPPPDQPAAAPAKKKKKRKKKKKVEAPPEEEQPPPAEPADEGWSTPTRAPRQRVAKWYDALPSLSGGSRADACRDIASGRGNHTTDHLPDLIDAVGEGPFDREVLARICLYAMQNGQVLQHKSQKMINKHYLIRTLPRQDGTTINLGSPIVVVHNTIANPLHTSCGTVYPK